MAVHRLWGGIKAITPWQRKRQATTDLGAVIASFVPSQVYIPMQQHIGAPCKPVVSIGDAVKLGQPVGEPDGFMSAAVHASVSGRVVDIREMPQANGKEATTVIIENDGKDTLCAPLEPYALDSLDTDRVIERLQACGVVGMGGATFPTHVKLKVKNPIDLLLINGSECEPLLAADDALMREKPDAILEGCLIAMRITGAKEAIIGIEDNKPVAIERMQTMVAGHGSIRVQPLKTQYPRGGEKQLIQSLAGREVPEGGLPSDVGVVLLNVGTAVSVADAVLRGRPLTHRLCTVTGDIEKPKTVRFPIGTLADELITFCGGPCDMPARVTIGGPMMGAAIEQLAVPMIKGANGLLLFEAGHVPALEDDPCIRCIRCVDACPMHLLPLFLDDEARKENWKACKRLHAQSCINCGCCTYVCPAGRRLAETITGAKNTLTAMEKEAKA